MKPNAAVDAASRDLEAIDPRDAQITPANFADVRGIKAIIDPYAARDLMLPRTSEEIFENIREFRVSRVPSGVIGCVALHIFSPEIAEVRALAVHGDYRGVGIGSRLVAACLDEARSFGIPKAFTLTLEDGFFGGLGFRPVERNTLTLKVWQECYRCPKFDRCDEVAMVMDLV